MDVKILLKVLRRKLDRDRDFLTFEEAGLLLPRCNIGLIVYLKMSSMSSFKAMYMRGTSLHEVNEIILLLCSRRKRKTYHPCQEWLQ